MLSPSVAALTSVTGSQSSASARQRVGLQVGAERDAAHRLRGDERAARQVQAGLRADERRREADDQRGEQRRRGEADRAQREREDRGGGAQDDPWRRLSHGGEARR